MHSDVKLLGAVVVDMVTGFAGVVTSVSFDISGCIQGLVQPEVNKEGIIPDSRWFDTKRLQKVNRRKVDVPEFVVIPGGQDLPKHSNIPIK